MSDGFVARAASNAERDSGGVIKVISGKCYLVFKSVHVFVQDLPLIPIR